MFSIIKKYKQKLNDSCKTKEKAISLVGLVVTIIILLILAAVTIVISKNKSGILQKSKQSIGMYENAYANESEESDASAKRMQKLIDKPKSQDIVLTPDISSWTRGSVTIVANVEKTNSEIELKSDDSDWSVRKNNRITVTSNQKIEARLKNKKEDIVTYNVTNIDKTAPESTSPSVVTTTNSIDATNRQTDNESGIISIQYQIKKKSDTTWGKLQTSGTFTGLIQNTEYDVRTHAVDKVGNASDSEATTAITKTMPKPVNGTNITTTVTPSTWTNKNVSVKVETTLTEFTLQTSKDGKTWGTTNTYTYTENGTVYVRLWDGINASEVASVAITNIDKIEPEQPQISAKMNNASGNEYKSGTWTNNNIYIELTSKDEGSGIKEYQWYENGAWTTRALTTKNNKGIITYTAKRNETIKFRAIDKAGNISKENTIDLKIDKTAPTKPEIIAKINDASGSEYTSGTWTKNNVYVELTSADEKSGIKEYQWYENGAWTTRALTTINNKGTITYTASRSETIRVRAIDNAGNASEENTIIVRIDKNVPTTEAPVATSTTNSITISNKQTDSGSGIATIQYQIKKNSDTTWGALQSSATFGGLTQNTKYDIRTHTIDKVGNVSDSAVATITTKTVPSGTTSGVITLTPSPSNWTNGNVTVTAKTNQTGYTIQVSKDGKTFSDGSTLTFTTNGTAYARLRDSSNNYGTSASLGISIIDKLAPTNTVPTVTTKTNSITITLKQVDQNAANGSGKSDINTSATRYRLVTDTNGTTAVSGKDWQTSNVFSGLTQNTTYYVQTRVTDKAGNTTNSAVTTAKTGTVPSGTTSGVITLTPSPSSWTNGNVTVTATTNQSGYTIQTSTDGKTFKDGSTLTFTANGTAYARLRDSSNNYGTSASLGISIIDKLAPTNTAPTVTTKTNSITITLKQVDQNAANGSGKSDINTGATRYRLVTDTNGTTAVSGKDWQTSNVFSGLTQNTTYYVQTRVTDKAGNTTSSAVTTAKTGTVPSGTTSGVITLTPSPSSWTNGNVTVTATTNQTGYTIQVSKDGKTFSDGSTLTFTANGTAYAR